ncbi:AAA family ATPase [Cohnella terricola]|uniref:AAA family ATPase n=1 Tax=Cohnella terricola TaxID=1289167 RepID=A0A559JBA4_9BACL|nr:AAA family ATPase [Cohnella terricola]TVX97160.1 AAA family ATPase [Cohnella terricola]
MIIWINGAFGSGKSQTAYELHRRLPNSYVYDPENAGYYIRKNVPKEISKPDFQDYPMWRETNYAMLEHLNREYTGIVIAPMTIVQSEYFDEIVGRLRASGADVRHYSLCASKGTLLRRLKSRGEGERSWAAAQIDRCMEALSGETFRHHIDTDNLSVSDNAERIASMSGLTLSPDNRSKARKTYDRWATQIKQIRFFN